MALCRLWFFFGFGSLFGLMFAKGVASFFDLVSTVLIKCLHTCFSKLSDLNFNMENNTMKTKLILTLVGAVIGALVGVGIGWLCGVTQPCLCVGTAAGIVGIWTWNKWPSWFATQYVETWHSGAIMFVLCVAFGGAVGAFTGWNVRGLGLGALFGVIVVGMSYGIRKLPLNVQ